jgi:dienelactone hydrolase
MIMKRKIAAILMLVVVSLFVFSIQSEAALKAEKVEYKQGSTVLTGYLAYEDSYSTPRPGVLVVHEWWGLNDHAKKRAEELAREGYIALAVDMYGGGKTTAHPKEAGEWATALQQNKQLGKERFLAGYALLRTHPLTQKDRMAAIGYCFGGHVVLLMAQEGADLKGVVSFHGSLPTDKAEPKSFKAKVLVCHGADDPMVTREQIAAYQDNLRIGGADWLFMVYGGAKHSFTNPDADKVGIPGLAYNKTVDQRSWKLMLSFLDELFAQ